MKFVLAIAENEVPSTKAPDPYMHIFLYAGGGNVLAFFDLPSRAPMGRDRTYLEDGDKVVLRGGCEQPGAARIGFGECVGKVLPALTT